MGSWEEASPFDRAIVRFLTEVASSVRDVNWNVRGESDGEWEIALWLNGEYAGTWRVTEEGHTLLDPDDVEFVVVKRRARYEPPWTAEYEERVRAGEVDE